MDDQLATANWHPAKKFCFRFVFAYLVLYGPLCWLLRLFSRHWSAVPIWVGNRLFGVEATPVVNGSGDTTYNYLEVFCLFLLAIAATVVWTIFAKSDANYARLYRWLRVGVRFYLAMILITYGSAKVISTQFIPPTLDRLLQPLGEASPMGLLWMFMGASTSYTVFTGAAEMAAGLLLTARRTTLLGAMVAIGVMSNVVMLNFCYDVPVKLYSCHYLAMALFLAVPDFPRLANLFVFNRPVEPAAMPPLFRTPRGYRAALVLRTGLTLLFVGYLLIQSHFTRSNYLDFASLTPLFGIWEVDQSTVGNQHDATDDRANELRWRRVLFPYPSAAWIEQNNHERQFFTVNIQQGGNLLTLTRQDDPAWKSTLHYEEIEPDKLKLSGEFDGRPLEFRLHRFDEKQFLLVGRGFHWINEFPFNR